LRKKITEAKTRKAEEERRTSTREQETQVTLTGAELLGEDLLTSDGRDVLALPEGQQASAMRALLDAGKEPFTAEGKRLLSAYDKANDKHREALQSLYPDEKLKDVLTTRVPTARERTYLEPYERVLTEIEDRINAARAKARSDRMRPQAEKAMQRMRQEIESYAKQHGKLPDEDTATRMAFAGDIRDSWYKLTLKFKILDAASGKYVITSAGPDGSYDTADDPQWEFQVGK
jgi:hypothetical protein